MKFGRSSSAPPGKRAGKKGAEKTRAPAESSPLERLAEARRAGRGVLVCAPAVGTAFPAALIEVGEDGIEVAFEELQHREELSPRSVALITFGQSDGTSAFFSRVVEISEGSGKLEVPSKLITTDARLTFRIPLIGEHGLRVHIELPGGEPTTPDPINISMGGLGIRLSETQELQFEVMGELDIVLERDGARLTTRGVARHRTRGQLGIEFQLAGSAEEPDVPQELRALVMELQRHWLRNRAA